MFSINIKQIIKWIIISEYEPNDGYTSTASLITNNIINPLKFKIYSHDIMIMIGPKGFYIERHNEYYQQSHDIINDKNIQNTNDNLEVIILFYFIIITTKYSNI